MRYVFALAAIAALISTASLAAGANGARSPGVEIAQYAPPSAPDIPNLPPSYQDVPGARIPGGDTPRTDTPGYPDIPNTDNLGGPNAGAPGQPAYPNVPDTIRSYSPEQEKRDNEERDRLDALQRSLSGEKPPVKGNAPLPGTQVPPAPARGAQTTTPVSPVSPAVPSTPAEATAPQPTPGDQIPPPTAAVPIETAPTIAAAPEPTSTPVPNSGSDFWYIVGGIAAAVAAAGAVLALGPLSTREKPGTGNPNPVPGPGDGPDDPNAQRPTYTETRELVTREGMVKKANPPPQDPTDIPLPPTIYGHDDIIGCCGPDITEQLIGVLKTVVADYDALPWYKKAVQAVGFGFWDVEPLRDRLGQIMPANCGLPKQSNCAGTVMLFDRCFEAGVVNYTIYGVIEVLCVGNAVGAVAHGAYWLVKEVTGKSSVRSLAAENFMVSVGREFARGGGAGMKEQVQKVKGNPCGKCPLPAKPFHWNYTWAPLFINQPSRY